MSAATSDSQLSKTEISSIKINSEIVPVYQLHCYNGNNALMLRNYQDKMLVFSSADMLLKMMAGIFEAAAIAGDLLSGRGAGLGSAWKSWCCWKKRQYASACVVTRLLGFGYQRLMPSFAGVRFEMGNNGSHSFVAFKLMNPPA